jgi:hydroxypyruvate isomerase
MSVSNALYGQRQPAWSPREQDDVATANLAAAADALADAGATVVVEPLHRGRNGAYPLETADDVVAVLDRVTAAARHGRPGLLFDTFHLAGNGEDLLDVIARHGDRIRHVQLADEPGRGEPGSGTIDLAAVLVALASAGYSGAVAAEYDPGPGLEPSFEWAARLPVQPPRGWASIQGPRPSQQTQW